MSRGKTVKGSGSGAVGTGMLILGLVLAVVHVMVIYEDVQAVVNDPNKENKPGEILKLAVDVTRYFPK